MSHDLFEIFGSPIYVSVVAEASIVKFCTQVGYYQVLPNG